MTSVTDMSVLEICAGAGGQSLGLEMAGFSHSLAVEIDADACRTLRLNRPKWSVHEGDVREVDGKDYRGVDLLAGGVPCPPFSVAGNQLGADDERDLFPEALRLVREAQPRAVLLENVRGLSTAKFAAYRQSILDELGQLGYHSEWQVINSCEHGVPQLRPRFVLVALQNRYRDSFHWPEPVGTPPTVGKTLLPLMKSGGWIGAEAWASKANAIGPTLVGGSRKHGGPDLGPTRARAAWLALGVNGSSLANEVPDETYPEDHVPRLTVEMTALVQGFPPEWKFSGRKTASYRQVGNAFPPPVAKAIGLSIRKAIGARSVIREIDAGERHLRAV